MKDLINKINENLTFDMGKQCLITFLKVIILLTIIIFILDLGLNLNLNFNVDISILLSLTVTIFIITFTVSQFLITRISDSISMTMIKDYKDSSIFVKFYMYEIFLIIYYSILFSFQTKYNDFLGLISLLLFLLSIYLIIKLTDLYFLYSDPTEYSENIYKTIINNLKDPVDTIIEEKIDVLTKICTKEANNDNLFIKRNSEYLFNIIKIMNNKNQDDFSLNIMDLCLKNLYNIYKYSITENITDISYFITNNLWEIYNNIIFTDSQMSYWGFDENTFFDVFFKKDNQEGSLNSFLKEGCINKVQSRENIRNIISDNIIITYNNFNKDKKYYDFNYLWEINKMLIDADDLTTFKDLINNIVDSKIEVIGDENRNKINMYEINAQYYVIGGYLLYLQKSKKYNIDQYIYEIWNHNRDDSGSGEMGFSSNFFIWDEYKMIKSLSLNGVMWLTNYSLNKKFFNLKHYILQFFIISFVRSPDSSNFIENEKCYEHVSSFLSQKDKLMNAFKKIVITNYLYNYLMSEDPFYENKSLKSIEDLRKEMNNILEKKFERIEKFKNDYLRKWELNDNLKETIKDNLIKSFEKNIEKQQYFRKNEDITKNCISIPLKIPLSKHNIIISIDNNKINEHFMEDYFNSQILKRRFIDILNYVISKYFNHKISNDHQFNKINVKEVRENRKKYQIITYELSSAHITDYLPEFPEEKERYYIMNKNSYANLKIDTIEIDDRDKKLSVIINFISNLVLEDDIKEIVFN